MTNKLYRRFSKMTEEEWRETMIVHMNKYGWALDRDDETTLGFTLDGWIRDYDKKTRRFVHFNGNQIVNLKITKVNDE